MDVVVKVTLVIPIGLVLEFAMEFEAISLSYNITYALVYFYPYLDIVAKSIDFWTYLVREAIHTVRRPHLYIQHSTDLIWFWNF